MTEFKKYITQFRCKAGEQYTHTSIDEPKGSFKLPDEKMSEFYEVYNRALMQGQFIYMTEKPKDPSPMRLDLDFRFSMQVGDSKQLIRKYTDEHIITILKTYNELLSQYVDSKDPWKAYVMEKPKPVEYRGKIKDGIHVIWPGIVLSHAMQNLLRKHILNVANDMFRGLPVTNTFEDIIDLSLIHI